MTIDTDLVTLRDAIEDGRWIDGSQEDSIDERREYLAALDRVETELARLREHEQEAKNLGYDGMRQRAEAAERELARLREGLRRVLNEAPYLDGPEKELIRALLADTPEDGAA